MFLALVEAGDGFVICNLEDGTFLNQLEFFEDIESAMHFDTRSGAQIWLDEAEYMFRCWHPRRCILPITVKVNNASKATAKEIGEYLQSAVNWIVNREVCGNGPTPDCYVHAEIHWDLIKDLSGPLENDPDDPYDSWGEDNRISIDDL